jgi:hypothetical protein
MRNIPVIVVTLILLAAAAANLCGRGLGRVGRYEVVLYHKDGSRGAEIISVEIYPDRIYLISQLNVRLLDPAVRELALPVDRERGEPMVHKVWLEPPLPTHGLSFRTMDLLPLAGVYLLPLWRRRQQRRPGGFPVVGAGGGELSLLPPQTMLKGKLVRSP